MKKSQMDYIVTAGIIVRFTVSANSVADARHQATTLKQYCMTSPDGERIDIDDEAVISVEQRIPR